MRKCSPISRSVLHLGCHDVMDLCGGEFSLYEITKLRRTHNYPGHIHGTRVRKGCRFHLSSKHRPHLPNNAKHVDPSPEPVITNYIPPFAASSDDIGGGPYVPDPAQADDNSTNRTVTDVSEKQQGK